jgi:hypothetical protein
VKTERTSNSRPFTGALALWLGIQLSIILITVLRIPLAAHYVEPAEGLAPHLLLGAQVVAAGLLFPFLLRDLDSTAQVLATAIPFQLAAGYLGGLSMGELMPAAGFVAGWIATLHVWAIALPDARTQMLGVGLANCATLGGAILRYLRLEFTAGPFAGASFESSSPLLTTLAALAGESVRRGWLFLLSMAVVGLLVRGIQKYNFTKTSPKRCQAVTPAARSASGATTDTTPRGRHRVWQNL